MYVFNILGIILFTFLFNFSNIICHKKKTQTLSVLDLKIK